MKSFKQFNEAFASRAEAEKHYGSDPDYTFNNAGSTANPKWRRVKKSNRKNQASARKQRLTPGNLASKEDAAKGERKKKVIQKKGMEAHHITPTHTSQKARGKMSDAEWKKKKERDAKGHGVYHGDHPRNLAATTGPKTPKDRKGIPHRAKGYHEAEGEERKSKSSGPVVGTSRDIIAARNRKASQERKRKELGRQNEELVYEVAPPGWGHTKAEKEKTDPSKPKSKIGGTAAAFKRALDRGDFKGLPGSKTKKEKTADMFKLMWAMKNKGDKPHYKPGTDEKYKKYQEEETSPMPNVSTKDKGAIRKRSKNLFKKDITGEHQGVNETFVLEREDSPYEKASDKALDKKYGYGTSHDKGPKTGFGRASNRATAAAVLKDLRRRRSKSTSETRADAAHKGWSHTARTSADQTPEKKATRKKLADTPYKKLPKDEQEKDQVAADAVKKEYDKRKKTNESIGFEIDSGEHKKASRKAKLRNLAKGNTNPNEKAAAEKKAGGPKLIGELNRKDYKKLQKASVLATSDNPEDQDKARARQVEIDYKDLMRQRKSKKVGVGRSMREEKKSCPEGEYYCFDMGKCRPIPEGHKVREDGELVKEATTMRDNNLYGNAYAGLSPKLKREKKKAIDRIPNKRSEVYSRNLKHKSPIDPRESVELHDANGNLSAEIIDIIKPEPMKVPKSSVKWEELIEVRKLPNYNKTGNIIDVYLAWRGRTYSIQMFFPQIKKPSRKDVIDQLEKVYPGSKIHSYQIGTYNPGEPVLQIN